MNIETLFKLSYGMFVVSSLKEKKLNGQISNTVFQVVAEPPVIAACVNRKNLTNDFIRKNKKFSVSVLSEKAPMKFIGLFGFKSGKEIDKFENTNYIIGKTGVPVVLEYTLGYLECEVIDTVEVDTYTIFIARVVEAEIVNDEKPMTYSYYREVIRGKSPKTAPTYFADKKIKKES